MVQILKPNKSLDLIVIQMKQSKGKRKKAYTTHYKAQSTTTNNRNTINTPPVQPKQTGKPLSKKLRIPIVGVLSILITFYFLTDPRIKLPVGEEAILSMQTKKFGDSISIMYQVTVPLINTHFRKGFIDRVEVNPNGIKFLPYNIQSIEIDKDWIPYNEIRFVKFQVTVNYPIKSSTLQTTNDNIRNFPGLRFQIFDNKNNAILHQNEYSSWFYIAIARNLK